MDLNHNISSCIKETSNWGEHIYTNVCTGAVTIVPWGIAEYGAVIFGTGLMLVCAVMMVRMLK
jgi:hypothetical protein